MTYCYHPNKPKITIQFETLVLRLKHEPYLEGSNFETQLHSVISLLMDINLYQKL